MPMTRLNPSTQPLKGVTRTSVADSAYEAIRESILRGQYPPGEQLVEARLASELGVSRGTGRGGRGGGGGAPGRRATTGPLHTPPPRRGCVGGDFVPGDLIDIYNVRIG